MIEADFYLHNYKPKVLIFQVQPSPLTIGEAQQQAGGGRVEGGKRRRGGMTSPMQEFGVLSTLTVHQPSNSLSDHQMI
jgi:hypothetical protein